MAHIVACLVVDIVTEMVGLVSCVAAQSEFQVVALAVAQVFAKEVA